MTLQIQKDESEEIIVKNVQRSLSARPDRTIDCTGNSASDLLSTLVSSFLFNQNFSLYWFNG